MESFDRIPLAALALICLKSETKADAERTCATLSPPPARMWLRRRVARGYCATWNLRTKRTRWNWQTTAWGVLVPLLPRWRITNEIVRLKSPLEPP
jgi:hypothetical protein